MCVWYFTNRDFVLKLWGPISLTKPTNLGGKSPSILQVAQWHVQRYFLGVGKTSEETTHQVQVSPHITKDRCVSDIFTKKEDINLKLATPNSTVSISLDFSAPPIDGCNKVRTLFCVINPKVERQKITKTESKQDFYPYQLVTFTKYNHENTNAIT